MTCPGTHCYVRFSHLIPIPWRLTHFSVVGIHPVKWSSSSFQTLRRYCVYNPHHNGHGSRVCRKPSSTLDELTVCPSLNDLLDREELQFQRLFTRPPLSSMDMSERPPVWSVFSLREFLSPPLCFQCVFLEKSMPRLHHPAGSTIPLGLACYRIETN